MGFIKRQQQEIDKSRVCGWFLVRPGRSGKVELWEKWWPSGFQYKVRIEHCIKAIHISSEFASNEHSVKSMQLAASLMERRIDPVDVRKLYRYFHAEYISNLWVPRFGGARWVLSKDQLVAWVALKKDMLEGINDVEELVNVSVR